MMAKDFDTSGDIVPDTGDNVSSDAGSDCGGDLAHDTGVDLNDGAGNDLRDLADRERERLAVIQSEQAELTRANARDAAQAAMTAVGENPPGPTDNFGSVAGQMAWAGREPLSATAVHGSHSMMAGARGTIETDAALANTTLQSLPRNDAGEIVQIEPLGEPLREQSYYNEDGDDITDERFRE
jgi:hypothetical protein